MSFLQSRSEALWSETFWMKEKVWECEFSGAWAKTRMNSWVMTKTLFQRSHWPLIFVLESKWTRESLSIGAGRPCGYSNLDLWPLISSSLGSSGRLWWIWRTYSTSRFSWEIPFTRTRRTDGQPEDTTPLSPSLWRRDLGKTPIRPDLHVVSSDSVQLQILSEDDRFNQVLWPDVISTDPSPASTYKQTALKSAVWLLA